MRQRECGHCGDDMDEWGGRYIIKQVADDALGWSELKTKGSAALCESCAADFEEYVKPPFSNYGGES